MSNPLRPARLIYDLRRYDPAFRAGIEGFIRPYSPRGDRFCVFVLADRSRSLDVLRENVELIEPAAETM